MIKQDLDEGTKCLTCLLELRPQIPRQLGTERVRDDAEGDTLEGSVVLSISHRRPSKIGFSCLEHLFMIVKVVRLPREASMTNAK